MKPNRYHIRNLLSMDDPVKWQLREWRNQPFVRSQMVQNEEISQAAHVNYLQSLPQHPVRQVHLLLEGEHPIGVMHLDWFKEEASLEFGFYVIHEKDQYRGLGALMEYMILEHAFHQLGANQVFCRTLITNDKTVALHRKFGFEADGEERIASGRSLLRQTMTRQRWHIKKDQLKKMLLRIAPVEDIQWQTGGN